MKKSEKHLKYEIERDHECVIVHGLSMPILEAIKLLILYFDEGFTELATGDQNSMIRLFKGEEEE